ncbi:MAG: hypothetical protein ACK5C5_06295 [Bacteroidota bacterium]|jgi:hypothetical protein
MNFKHLLLGALILLTNSAQAQSNDSISNTKDSLLQNTSVDSILQNGAVPQINHVKKESRPATLFIYRPGAFIGAAVGYDLYKGDKVICRVRNNSKYQINIDEEGVIELWAKTEKKKTIQIFIEPGQSYYLKCGIVMGAFVGRPEMTIVSKEQGESDIAKIKD